MQRGSRMAKHTLFAHRTRKIWIGHIFVARRQVIGLPAGVESHWRLEEMPADFDEIAAGMVPGTNYIPDAVITTVARIFPMLPITSWRGTHGDRGAVPSDCTLRFLSSTPQGMGHSRTGISLDLGRVAEHATTRASGRAWQRQL